MTAEFIYDNKLIHITNINTNEREKMCYRYVSEEFDYQKKRMIKKSFINYIKDGSMVLPSGFWYSLLKEFNGLDFKNLNNFFNHEFIDEKRLEAFLKDPTFSNYTPHEHQIKSLYKSILYRQCRSYIDVSGGKTFTIYMICRYAIQNILKNNEKILIVVPKPDLVLQFGNDVNEYQVEDQPKSNKLIIQKIYAGIRIDKPETLPKTKINDVIIEDSNVVIGSRSTLCKYPKEFFDNFSVVIFDECHTLRSTKQKGLSQSQQVYMNLNFNKIDVISGFSGTMPEEGDSINNMHKKKVGKIKEYGYKKSEELLTIESLFGGTLIKKSLTDLVKDGSSSDFEITQVIINIDDIDFALDFYQDEDILNEKKRRYREMELLYARNEQEILLKKRLLKKYNENHIILFNTIAYLNKVKDFIENDDELSKLYDVHVIVGDVKRNDREIIKKEIEKDGGNIILATYATMDTGTSIKRLHNLYILDSCKEFYRVRQYIGRGVRLHNTKEKLNIFDFVYKIDKPVEMLLGGRTNIIYRQSKTRRDIYSFNNYKYKVIEINSSDVK